MIPANGTLGTDWTNTGFDWDANGFISDLAAIGDEKSPGNNINFTGQFETDLDPLGDGQTINTLETPDEGPSDNQQYLRITEFKYHPTDSAGEAEYIEFTNISSGASATALNLTGVTISEGPGTPFEFPVSTVLPAELRLVVVKSIAAFTAAYPDANTAFIAGTYLGSLSNGGGVLTRPDLIETLTSSFDSDVDVSQN